MPVVHVITADAECLVPGGNGGLAFACWVAPNSQLSALVGRARERAAAGARPAAPRPPPALRLMLWRGAAEVRELPAESTVAAEGLASGDEVRIEPADKPPGWGGYSSPADSGSMPATASPPLRSAPPAPAPPPPPQQPFGGSPPRPLASPPDSPGRRPLPPPPPSRWAPSVIQSPADPPAATPHRSRGYPLLTPSTQAQLAADPLGAGPPPGVWAEAAPAAGPPPPPGGWEPPSAVRSGDRAGAAVATVASPPREAGCSRAVWVRVAGHDRFDPQRLVVAIAHRLRIDPHRVDVCHLARDRCDSKGMVAGPAPRGSSNRKFVFPKPKYDKSEKRYALRPSPFTHERPDTMLRLRIAGAPEESDALAATLLRRLRDKGDVIHTALPGVQHAAFATLAAATPEAPPAEFLSEDSGAGRGWGLAQLHYGFYDGFVRAELKLTVMPKPLAAEAMHQWSVYHRWPNALPDIDAPWALSGALREARRLRTLPTRPKPAKPFESWGPEFTQGESWTGVQSPPLRETLLLQVTPPPSPRGPAQALWLNDHLDYWEQKHPSWLCGGCGHYNPVKQDKCQGCEKRRPKERTDFAKKRFQIEEHGGPGGTRKPWIHVLSGETDPAPRPETPPWKKKRPKPPKSAGTAEGGDEDAAAEGGGGGGGGDGDGGEGGGGGGEAKGGEAEEALFLGAWARLMAAHPESPPSRQDLAEFRRAKEMMAKLSTRPYDPRRVAGPPKGGYSAGKGKGGRKKVDLIPDPQTGIKVTMVPPGHDKPMLAAISEVTADIVRMEFVDKKNVGRVDVPMAYYREQQAATAAAAGGGGGGGGDDAAKKKQEDGGAAEAAPPPDGEKDGKGKGKKKTEGAAAAGAAPSAGSSTAESARKLAAAPWPVALAELWDLAAAQGAARRRRSQLRQQQQGQRRTRSSSRGPAPAASAAPRAADRRVGGGHAQQHIEGRKRLTLRQDAERSVLAKEHVEARATLYGAQREWDRLSQVHQNQLQHRRMFECCEESDRLSIELGEVEVANALARVVRVLDMEYAWRVALWLHWDEYTTRCWLTWTQIGLMETEEEAKRGRVAVDEKEARKKMLSGGTGTAKKVYRLDVPEPATGTNVCIIPPGKDYVAPGRIVEVSPDYVRVGFEDKRELGRMDIPHPYYKEQQAKFAKEQADAAAAAAKGGGDEEDDETREAREQAERAAKLKAEQMILLATECEPMVDVWEGWKRPPRDDDGAISTEKVLQGINKDLVAPRSLRYGVVDLPRKPKKSILVLPSCAEEIISDDRVQARWERVQQRILDLCAAYDNQGGQAADGVGGAASSEVSDGELFELGAPAPRPAEDQAPAERPVAHSPPPPQPRPAAWPHYPSARSPPADGPGGVWRSEGLSAGPAPSIWRSPLLPAGLPLAGPAPLGPAAELQAPPACGSFPPCADPAVVDVTLDMRLEDFRGGAFREEMAQAVGLSPANIEVLSVRRGSVHVRMRVAGLPPADAARMAAIIAARAADPDDGLREVFRPGAQCGPVTGAALPAAAQQQQQPSAGGSRGAVTPPSCPSTAGRSSSAAAGDCASHSRGDPGASDAGPRGAGGAARPPSERAHSDDQPEETEEEEEDDWQYQPDQPLRGQRQPFTSDRRSGAGGPSRKGRGEPRAQRGGESDEDEQWAALQRPPTPSDVARVSTSRSQSRGGARGATPSASTATARGLGDDIGAPPSPRGRYTGSPRARVMRQPRGDPAPRPAAATPPRRYTGPKGREGGQQALQKWRPRGPPSQRSPAAALRGEQQPPEQLRPAASLGPLAAEEETRQLSESVRVIASRLAARDEELRRLERRRKALEREIGLARRAG
eukprot:TRINITY_DN2125_c0_g2_i1.p1 TRINITY_DN2125_c0_g2~~TRINITY_DN2125_c0_g2_i1.p1  ORF type:complete len:1852 (+),score=544.21 TRINITY_DN2125_c0_g2_i1:73-5556(+)